MSLRHRTAFQPDRLHSSRMITDVYLLALALKNGGTLATFDQSVPVSAIPGAAVANLCKI